jgi:sulfoxide reductase heme-binding subunit YedZ
MVSPRRPAAVTNDVHRFVSSLALWMIGLHLLMLLVDSEAGASLANLVVPLTADYRPLATSLGVIALYAMLAVRVSTAMRRRIGHRRWRQLHGLAFVAYAAALGHGLFAGTDSSAGWARALYASSALLVAGLLVVRLTASGTPRPPAPAAVAEPATPAGRPTLPPLQPRYRHDPAGRLPPPVSRRPTSPARGAAATSREQ